MRERESVRGGTEGDIVKRRGEKVDGTSDY
jgi:hypothetical protein